MASEKLAVRPPTLKRIPFLVLRGKVREVIVTGDFTGWTDEGIRLKRGPNGDWTTTLKLAPGEYQYRLRVDGVWEDHAEASKHVPNPFGTRNCVLTVT
jgi:1,4-alpha-glucan branching enzyme